jgi:hypothetical protein
MYFAFGILLGCGLVYGMLIKDRDFPAWLPGDRVIEELTSHPISVADSVTLPFPDSLLPERINASEVLFKESVVREKPCRTYQLESEIDRLRVRICDSTVTIVGYAPIQK